MSDDRPYDDVLRLRLQAAAAFGDQQGPLPSHHPRCFGCGEDADPGLHLVARREGPDVRSEVAFQAWHAGAPGIVHGGMVSAACDDFLGFVMYLSPRVGVTRALEVSFVRPALVGVRYALRGWVEHAQEHKAWFAGPRADLVDADPVVAAAGEQLRGGGEDEAAPAARDHRQDGEA